MPKAPKRGDKGEESIGAPAGLACRGQTDTTLGDSLIAKDGPGQGAAARHTFIRARLLFTTPCKENTRSQRSM